eukprot:1167962-Pyramimonas_sp.AAC.1
MPAFSVRRAVPAKAAFKFLLPFPQASSDWQRLMERRARGWARQAQSELQSCYQRPVKEQPSSASARDLLGRPRRLPTCKRLSRGTSSSRSCSNRNPPQQSASF